MSILVVVMLTCSGAPVFGVTARSLQSVPRIQETLARGAVCDSPAIATLATDTRKNETHLLEVISKRDDGWIRCVVTRNRQEGESELNCSAFTFSGD